MQGNTIDPDMDHIVNFSAYRRRAWVSDKAKSLQSGSKVLDAGAGECQYRDLFAHCIYKAQDFAQYSGTETGPLKEAWRYGQLDYVCDLTSIPVPDAEFDAVLCTEVLEHVAHPGDVIRELSRVMKPGGRLFLTAPLASGLHQRPHHYYGGYTPHFYQAFLPAHHFEIRELQPLGGLMLHVAQELHRAGRALDDAKVLSPWMRLILMYWLPRYLAIRERKLEIPEFTVGYMVEAVKRS